MNTPPGEVNIEQIRVQSPTLCRWHIPGREGSAEARVLVTDADSSFTECPYCVPCQ